MSAFQKSRGTEAKAGAVDTCDDWGKGRKLETYIIALLYFYTHSGKFNIQRKIWIFRGEKLAIVIKLTKLLCFSEE